MQQPDKAKSEATAAQPLASAEVDVSPVPHRSPQEIYCMTNSGKRKQSPAHASPEHQQSKRHQGSSAGQCNSRTGDFISPSAHTRQTSNQQPQASPKGSDTAVPDQLQLQQFQEDRVIADTPGAQQETPEAEAQTLADQQAQPPGGSLSSRPSADKDAAHAADAAGASEASLAARDSDYQDAQERLSTLDEPQLQLGNANQLSARQGAAAEHDSMVQHTPTHVALEAGLSIEVTENVGSAIAAADDTAALDVAADSDNDVEAALTEAQSVPHNSMSSAQTANAQPASDVGTLAQDNADDAASESEAPSALGVAAAIPLPRTSALQGAACVKTLPGFCICLLVACRLVNPTSRPLQHRCSLAGH